MTRVKMSERLTRLAGLVPEGSVLADVGTDHGFVPIQLCLEDRIPSAIAMDVRTGPLERAQEHIHQYALEDRIETRLSDGLEGLRPGEADTILIAGMGGILMRRILTDGAVTAKSAKTLILQPQSDLMQFRMFLAEDGYDFLSEDMVKEDGKYYPMMVVSPSGCAGRLNPTDACFGPLLLRNRHPILLEWMGRELEIRKRILDGLELEMIRQKADQDGRGRLEERLAEIRSRVSLLEEALCQYYR